MNKIFLYQIHLFNKALFRRFYMLHLINLNKNINIKCIRIIIICLELF